MQPRYKFYATLLDAFQWYKNSQSEDAFTEFIDRVNRVPFESEAADKGTAFNEAVDMCLKGEEVKDGCMVLVGRFGFEQSLVNQFTDRLSGALSQVHTSALIETDRGLVEVYGYIDELLPGEVIDIKTTKSYTFPKYLHNWQHVVYPYCIYRNTGHQSTFTYLVTDFKEVYDESYQYKHERDEVRLRNICEELIEFLETYRHLITDKKVFAEELVLAEYDNELSATIVSNG